MSENKTLYLAIIADIIDSKSIEKRNEVQVNLKEILNNINEKYKDAIASNFTITLGDEFQGVLHKGSDVMTILETIQKEMHPIALRFGIGLGTISTALDPKLSLGADGKAYHQARKMIIEVKNIEKQKMKPKTNILIGIEGNERIAKHLNTILKLSWAIQSTWSNRQREIIAEVQKTGGTQTDIAKTLGIVQSSVQKSLANSQYYTFIEAMEHISESLAKLMEESNV
ncbi:SatD family protein [Sphaerochaeta sp. PS]|uniref:SatD family protein n=1 Tax=Sphaerochaeta sp. PS TaxID=3076336 RepID=UPI0028A3D534|nr:SatD family protein [Sphaerochaeta sp. PS]MDT4761358.1 SatD family protein [Sphaerochaeta sp. PS]